MMCGACLGYGSYHRVWLEIQYGYSLTPIKMSRLEREFAIKFLIDGVMRVTNTRCINFTGF